MTITIKQNEIFLKTVEEYNNFDNETFITVSSMVLVLENNNSRKIENRQTFILIDNDDNNNYRFSFSINTLHNLLKLVKKGKDNIKIDIDIDKSLMTIKRDKKVLSIDINMGKYMEIEQITVKNVTSINLDYFKNVISNAVKIKKSENTYIGFLIDVQNDYTTFNVTNGFVFKRDTFESKSECSKRIVLDTDQCKRLLKTIDTFNSVFKNLKDNSIQIQYDDNYIYFNLNEIMVYKLTENVNSPDYDRIINSINKDTFFKIDYNGYKELKETLKDIEKTADINDSYKKTKYVIFSVKDFLTCEFLVCEQKQIIETDIRTDLNNEIKTRYNVKYLRMLLDSVEPYFKSDKNNIIHFHCEPENATYFMIGTDCYKSEFAIMPIVKL